MVSICSGSLKRIALIGNPNCGKSSVFNALTGLNQKIGNYPGVTVERSSGSYLWNGEKIEVVDLPGTYSLYPGSRDELVVSEELLASSNGRQIHGLVYISDITMLDKELLLLSQVMDLEYPVVLALNMSDLQSPSSVERIRSRLEKEFGIRVIALSARRKTNIPELKSAIEAMLENKVAVRKFSEVMEDGRDAAECISGFFPELNEYGCLLVAHHHERYTFIDPGRKAAIASALEPLAFDSLTAQMEETLHRYEKMSPVIREANLHLDASHTEFSRKVDRWLVHPVAGPVTFLVMMLLVFQAVFTWSQYPMEGIEWIFSSLGDMVGNTVRSPWMADLLANGVLAGLGAILVFVPQIAILFFLLAILEQTGYMARVVYLFDPLMKRVGLSGRSIVALFSGAACAVPAIMSARTIRDPKEQLNTILVTPLISCSARLPVYILLIGMLVPAGTIGGIISKQAGVFILLYLISIASTFAMAWVFKRLLDAQGRSMLLLHLPIYKKPSLRDIVTVVWKKVKSFAWQAGRIIFVLSIVIWIASTYGPRGEMQAAGERAAEIARAERLDETGAARLAASMKLEHSFAGHLGKFIEPAIRPLGFDWKIGIGLISAFAAREVFVGTLATIYSVGDESDLKLHEKMGAEKFPDTGQPVYSFATIVSLLLFFLFAMQCMSTLAVVRKETSTWKWPVFQFFYMTLIAIAASFAAYQLLS
jgi:ferrous iron transport protein B